MKVLRLALHPVPELEKIDTSLRYTDILFGFVIRELFLRLKNFPELDANTKWHLIVGTTLVLGSWVGFRRSLNRSSYTVKFFNLPVFKFFLDQAMLVLYFRLAVMTNVDPGGSTDPMLALHTLELVTYVFALYVGWDLLGIRMSYATYRWGPSKGKPRYPAVVDGKVPDQGNQQPADWRGFLITVAFLIAFALLGWKAPTIDPNYLAFATIFLLLLYRSLKELRSSIKSPNAALA